MPCRVRGGQGAGHPGGGRIQSVPLTERRAVNIPAAGADHSEATRPGSFIFSEVGWSKIITIDTVLSTSCGLGYTIVVISVLKISVQLGFDNNCVCPLSCGLLALHSGRSNGRRHYKVPRNAPPQPSLNPASHKTQDTGPWSHLLMILPVSYLGTQGGSDPGSRVAIYDHTEQNRDAAFRPDGGPIQSTQRDNNEGRNNARG